MNILFITLLDINDIDEHNIYADLMRELAKQGNKINIVSPSERRNKTHCGLIKFNKCDDWHKYVQLLKVKTGNIQKTNILEKGISTILIEYQIKTGIKKYFKNEKFDLIIYSTPPITIVNPIKYVKMRDNAKTYLILKDIFPQNAVDLGMMSKTGLKRFIFKIFRNKEKQLYEISDKIGCMSQANVDYIICENPEISKEKVEIFPNCIELVDVVVTDKEKRKTRKKYGIPQDKKVFVYGGNLGKPQGISFVVDCLKNEKNNEEAFFLIIGDGTEYKVLQKYIDEEKATNIKLMKSLPKDDYDRMVASCDVGLIFLDYRFTIPNFPSRLLSYMQANLPVLACTDLNTDIGKIIVAGGFGLWCASNDVKAFSKCIKQFCDNCDMNSSLKYLKNFYSVKNNFEKLLK